MPGFNLIARLNVQANQASIRQAAQQVQQGLRGVTSPTIGVKVNPATEAGLRNLRTSLAATATAANASTTAMERFGAASGLAARRFAAFLVAGGGIITFLRGVREGFGEALQFQRQMVRLAQVADESQAKINSVGAEVSRLAKTFGVSSAELIRSAVTLKQAGLSIKDTEVALQGLAKAALAPNFDSLQQTTEGAIAAMRQFKLEAKDLEGALGSIDAVAGAFATEAGDIISAIQRAGGAFAAASGDFVKPREQLNQLIALFTSVRSTTRESAETIATGLRTIFTRVQRNETIESLRELGIVLRDNQGQFVGTYEAFNRLAERLNKLRTTDPRFSGIIEEIGGHRQVSRLIPLIQQNAEAQRALNIARAGEISLTLSAEKAQSALLVKTTALKEQYLELFRTIVNSRGFQAMADGALRLGEALGTVLKFATPLIPLLATLATIKLATSVGAFTTNFARQAFSGGPTVARAAGGVVPGVGNRDTVPAMLTPGEFVINKRAASIIGSSRLQALNSLGGAKGFSAGGPVQFFDDGGRVEKLPLASFPEAEFGALRQEVAELAAKLGITVDQIEAVNVKFTELGPKLQSLSDASGKLLQPFKASDFGGQGGGREAGIFRLQEKLTPAQSELLSRNIDFVDQVISRKGNRGAVRALGRETAFDLAQDELIARATTFRPELAESQDPKSIDKFFKAYAGQAISTRLVRALDDVNRNKGLAPEVGESLRSRELRPEQQAVVNQALADAGGNFDVALREAQRSAQRIPLTVVQTPQQAVGSARNFPLVPVRQPRGPNVLPPGFVQQVGAPALPAPNQLLLTHTPDVFSFADDDAFLANQRLSEQERRRAGRLRVNRLAPIQHGLRTELEPPLTQEERLRRISAGRALFPLRDEFQTFGVEGLPPSVIPFADDQPRLAQQAQVERARRRAERRRLRQFGTPLNFTNEEELERIGGGRNARLGIGNARRFAASDFSVPVPSSVETFGLQPLPFRERAAGVFRSAAGAIRGFGGQIAGVGGRIAGGFSSLRAGVGNVVSGLGQDINRFNASRAGQFISGIPSTASLIALPLFAQQAESFGGTAEQALASGSTTRFATGRGVGGALQGAVLGATVGGTIAGPLGVAVGGVTGALGGLISSLRGASDEIRAVKIDNALKDIKADLEVFARSSTPLEGGISGRLQSRGELVSREAAAQNERAATSLFGIFDAEQFQQLQRKSLRDNVGPQLGQITEGLSRQAETIGRSNIGKEVSELSQELLAGNQGLNRVYVQAIAELKGVSPAKALKDFDESIRAGQRSAVAERERLAARTGQEQVVNSFGRLVAAVQAAADSVTTLSQKTDLLNSGLTATVGVTSSSTALNRLGTPGSLAPLQSIAGFTGNPSLLNLGQVTANIRAVLPGILSQLASEGQLGDEDAATNVRGRLTKQLGTSPEVQRAINTIVAGIRDEKNLTQQLQIDTTKFTDGLLAPLEGPLQQSAGEISKLLVDNANGFIQNLAKLNERFRVIGDEQDKLGGLRLQAARVNAEQAGIVGGNRLGGTLLPFEQLQAPINARQRRLAGVNAFNPAGIGAELGVLRTQIDAARQRQQTAFDTGDQAGVQKAATELANLQRRAADLQQALGDLTNFTQQSAAAQERLARIESDRSSRLSFGEKVLTGTAEERQRIDRGLVLANIANNQGNFSGFKPDEIKAALEVLRSLGNAKLTGFKGSPVASDVAERLVRNTAGGVFDVDKDSRTEEAKLREVVKTSAELSAKAQEKLIEFLKTNATQQKDALTSQFAGFFTEMKGLLATLATADLQNKQGSAATEKAKFDTLQQQRKLLATVGITTTPQLQNAIAAQADLQGFAEAGATKRQQVETASKVNAAFSRGAFERSGLGGLGFNELVNAQGVEKTNAFLNTLGEFDPDQRARIGQRFRIGLGARLNDIENGGGDLNQEVITREARTQLQRAIQTELTGGEQGTVFGEALQKQGVLRERLKNSGFDVARLSNVDPAKLLEAIRAFDQKNTQVKLESLDAEIAKATAEFERLSAQLAQARAAVGGGQGQRGAAGAAGVPGVPGAGPAPVNLLAQGARVGFRNVPAANVQFVPAGTAPKAGPVEIDPVGPARGRLGDAEAFKRQQAAALRDLAEGQIDDKGNLVGPNGNVADANRFARDQKKALAGVGGPANNDVVVEALKRFDLSQKEFGVAANALSAGFATFAPSANALAEALNAFPRSIRLDVGPQRVDVQMNGAEVFGRLSNDMKVFVAQQVKAQLNRVFKERFPEAGVDLE